MHFQSFATFAVLAILGESGPSKVYKRLLTETQAQASGARALDGTPYAYYVSSKLNDGSIPSDWIIYLEGGGECEQYGDCIDRLKTQGSSTALPDTMDKAGVSDGMTSADANYNPHFHKFGTLFLPYLSGDDWLGTQRVACVPWGAAQNCTGQHKASGASLRPLVFAGSLNFQAAIKDWYSTLSTKPRSVLLSGGSAGGQGAFFHSDRLAELLPGVVVKSNPQYGWFGNPHDSYPDWKAGDHTDPSMPYPSSGSPSAAPAWVRNISIALPENCLLALSPDEDPFLCTSLPRVALTIQVPLFVSTNAFDGWLIDCMEKLPNVEWLWGDGGVKLGPTAKDDPRVQYLLEVTGPQQAASVLKAARAKPTNAAFMPACVAHPMLWTDKTAPVLGANNCTHGAAVASWFFDTTICERVLLERDKTALEIAGLACNRGEFKRKDVFLI